MKNQTLGYAQSDFLALLVTIPMQNYCLIIPILHVIRLFFIKIFADVQRWNGLER